MEKEYGKLSEFINRDVELFRSTDLENTAIYFCQREVKSAFFELLRFGYNGSQQQIYIRFPNTDVFIEMHGGGFGSSIGNMVSSKGLNVFGKYGFESNFRIHSLGTNLLLLFGDLNLPEFNFMEKIAEYNQGNRFDNERIKTEFNMFEIRKALAMPYQKIPDSIRRIGYCFRTKQPVPKYIIVDYPAFNFQYTNNRLIVVEDYCVEGNTMKVEEHTITNFMRARDGGTTKIKTVSKDGVEHTFFSPTPFNQTLCEKWDEEELVECLPEEKDFLVKLLGIDVLEQ